MTGTTIREDTPQRHLRKYTNPNPIHQWTLKRFFDTVAALIRPLGAHTVLEFGCGEGLFLHELRKRNIVFANLTGMDVRADALEHARRLNPGYVFEARDLMTWQRPPRSFDLVIASQVLEHLPEPEAVLRKLSELSRRHLLLTVPLEPWFRLMNLLRGRDVRRLGNHPEHVNLWSKKGFVRVIAPYVGIVRLAVSFPFTIVLATPKAGAEAPLSGRSGAPGC